MTASDVKDTLDEAVKNTGVNHIRVKHSPRLISDNGPCYLSKAKFSSPEELGVALSEMSPEARHLFRVGAAQALKGKLADIVSRADATKKLIDIQGLERKIELAFGDKNLFVRYTQFLENEKELFRAVTDVLGNSKTAERGAALADQVIDPAGVAQGVKSFMAGDFATAVRSFFQNRLNRMTTPPNQSEALARILTGRSIEGLKPISPQPLTKSGAPKSLQESLARVLSISEGTRIQNIE